MDLENEKKKWAAGAHCSFLDDRSFIPYSDEYGRHYVTAMLPPQDTSDEYYCQINSGARSTYQIPDYGYEDMDEIDCDPGVDVDDLFNQSLGFVCEEIVLHKNLDQKYGLTLFYCQNSSDPNVSDIFVGEIEPHSPASLVKGMRLGDQVLQINHQDVFTRDQVMHLFALSVNHIHLLLARSASQQLQLMAQSQLQPPSNDPYTMADLQHALDLYESLDTPSSMDALDADSGMGRLTDENVRAETSSDCSSFNSSRHGPIPFNTNTPSLPDDFIDLDMSKINDELNKLRWQCIYLEQIKAQKSIIEPSIRTGSSLNEQNPKPVPRMGTKLSPRINPNQNSPQIPKESPLLNKPDQSNRPTLTFMLPQNDNKGFPPVLRFSSFSSEPETPVQMKPDLSLVTINDSSSSQDPTVQPENPAPNQTAEGDKQMQWVMKKRSDGSKYLVKRPIRNQFLKDRAKQLTEDRQALSTDDDAASEIKTGRYWPRAERRRQFEKYREYKRQKEAMKLNMQSQEDQKTTKEDKDHDAPEIRVMLTFL